MNNSWFIISFEKIPVETSGHIKKRGVTEKPDE